ncbi:MAG: hypothetical protein QOE82_2715 [Thermoanaerobaculia bacterium]|jgi:hypothetical protein|nr:hypothetical protein [Thermoanaerobaculia bacterium]
MRLYAPPVSNRGIGRWLAILFVLAVYAFFAGGGKFDFRRLGTWQETNYASLAEGFLRGHLYLWVIPDPRLTALPYPYDFHVRGAIDYRWDTSYLNGHYYLYSSPLPVLLVYLPLRLLRGAYPPDSFVALIFSAWAFLAAVAFARRALRDRPLHIPFALWVLFIGLGNVAAFVLVMIHMYEIAILTGMAMTAMWALALLRYNESPTPSRAAWLALWLALSIAARPNLGVLLVVTAFVIKRSRKTIVAFLAPLAVVAIAMLWYNAARFGDPLEFGVRYQLTHVDMAGRKVCSLCTLPELSRFANNLGHYLFWPLHFRSEFPFLDAMPARLDPAVSWPTPGNMTEQIIGIAPLAPLMMLGTLIAILLALRRGVSDLATRSSLQVMAGAWLIIFGLSSCWWIVARYSLDFMMLMSATSVVFIELALTRLRFGTVRFAPVRATIIALACYSILTGILLGFLGPGDAFKRVNPIVFERVAGWFETPKHP